MSSTNICYWCSNPANSDEHIPPKNLFPKGHRKNLITVRSCSNHNQNFSKIDERMRFHMTSMGGDSKIAKKYFENETIRGLRRNESRGLVIDIVTSKVISSDNKEMFRTKSDNWNSYFEKIIRGLYFYQFNRILTGKTHFFSNKIVMMSLSANAHFFYHTIEYKLKGEWINGNPDNKEIFDYKYYFSERDKQFIVIMQFYENHTVIGLSMPEGKNIDDYGLDIDKYNQIVEEIKKTNK
jgi:hypothetical protein